MKKISLTLVSSIYEPAECWTDKVPYITEIMPGGVYDLGYVKGRVKSTGGYACLWGDSDSPDAEFTPVTGGWGNIRWYHLMCLVDHTVVCKEPQCRINFKLAHADHRAIPEDEHFINYACAETFNWNYRDYTWNISLEKAIDFITKRELKEGEKLILICKHKDVDGIEV